MGQALVSLGQTGAGDDGGALGSLERLSLASSRVPASARMGDSKECLRIKPQRDPELEDCPTDLLGKTRTTLTLVFKKTIVL